MVSNFPTINFMTNVLMLSFIKTPDEVVCNDISISRVERIRKVAKEYLFDTSAENKFHITHENALKIDKPNYYNKVSL